MAQAVRAGYNSCQPGRKRLRKVNRYDDPLQEPLFTNGAVKKTKRRAPSLPLEDNTPEGLRALLQANVHYRETG